MPGLGRLTLLAGALHATLCLAENQPRKPTYADPNSVDRDYALQGEYVGLLSDPDGKSCRSGVQVVALGNGEFRAVHYGGGLPGAGWDEKHRTVAEGCRDGLVVRFRGDLGSASLRDGDLEILSPEGDSLGTLKRTIRKSPTLGKKPPGGAVILFDGNSPDAFLKGRMTSDGLLMQGVTSKRRFGSCRLHLEFRLPYEPLDRGQDRGNSGVFLQGRFEVQMLDSFGLDGEADECGGIYQVKAPAVNMCLPPLQWQTFDIDFVAAKYRGGELVEDPRMTVRHNGVLIHDNVRLPGKRS
ncbi:MAG: DUF1080 domain-containing protein, partial [Planctomycetota bacterium]